MTELSVVLGVLIKAMLEIELAAILLRSILCIFLKRSSSVGNVLIYVTEPVIYPVRMLFSKAVLFSRVPIDMPLCVTFLILSALDALFGVWF